MRRMPQEISYVYEYGNNTLEQFKKFINEECK